jgi:hypothetical protein
MMIVFLPLAKPLRRHRRWAVLTFAGSRLSSGKGRSGRGCTTSNTTTGCRVRMVLVRTLICIARRTCTVFYNRSNLRSGAACHAAVRWRGSLARRTVQPGGRWWGRRNVGGMWAIVGVRDAVWLLLMGQ